MVVMDPPEHEKARSLLGRLLTPRCLKENEDYIWSLADRQLEEFIAKGKCEFLGEYGKPFARWRSPICWVYPKPTDHRSATISALESHLAAELVASTTSRRAVTRCSISMICSGTTLPSDAKSHARMC
jgi:hypothetical protein